MGRSADALSEKQVETLGWIRDGCPAVDGDTGVSHRISAASLRGRGLAKVKGDGATWTASITPAGLAWLDAHPATVAANVGGSDGLIARVLAKEGRLAIGGDEAEHQEEERERAAAERRLRWDAAMAAARARYDEQARWKAFEAPSRSWDAVARNRAFLAAAREAAGALDDLRREELLAHLDFAERRLDQADPLADQGQLRIGDLASTIGDAAAALRAVDPDRLWAHLEAVERQRAADQAANARTPRRALAAATIGAAGATVAALILVLIAARVIAV